MKKFAIALFAAAAVCTQTMAQSQVRTLSASTTKLNVEQLQSQDQAVQVNRYLFAGYNTLCLPMSMTAEQLSVAAPGVTVERMVAIRQEGSVLNLYFVDCTAEGIEAGMPYLIYSPKAQYLRAKNTESMGVNTDLKSVRLTDGEGNQVTFSSSWEAVSKEGRYGIPAQQDVTPLQSVLIRTQSDKMFLPTRCGFSWDQQSGSARELKIQHATLGEVTAIAGVEKTREAADTYYDLGGRKVQGQAKKGIYVVGGEKVVK